MNTNNNPVHILDLMMKADLPLDLNNLENHADFQILMANHRIESADLQNVMTAIQNCKSHVVRNVLLNQLGAITNITRSYRINMDISNPVEDLVKQAHQILDIEYWGALAELLKTRFILPYQSQRIAKKYLNAYINEEHYQFNQENINKLIEELKAFFSLDNIATEFEKAKSSLEIKTYANGSIEFKSHPDMCGYTEALQIKTADLFKKWWHQITFSLSDQPIILILCGVNDKDYAWKKTGIYADSMKNGTAVLKLNAGMAKRFYELTGYSPE